MTAKLGNMTGPDGASDRVDLLTGGQHHQTP